MPHAFIKRANGVRAEADSSATTWSASALSTTGMNDEKSTHRENTTDDDQRYAYEVGASLQ